MMELSDTQWMMVSLAGIFLLGIGAQWIAAALRLPSILLMLLFGFLAGPVAGLVDPDALLGELLFPVVSIAVSLVLFEGSLGLRFAELRGIAGPLRNLLTVGVLVSWASCTAAAWWLLEMELPTALLLGAILVVTGPTVIGPLLRDIRPVGSVGNIAKWEGIVIDPIGAVLAVLVFEGMDAVGVSGFQSAALVVGKGLLRTLAVGLLAGAGGAWILASLLRRHLIPDHLQSPVTLMVVVSSFVASNLIQHESGLLTVTVMGIVLVNRVPTQVKPIREFKEDLSVLLISSLFILLAARLRLEDFSALGWWGVAFVAFVILVARPAAVFVSCLGAGLKREERIFLAWLAPRGIVAAAVSSVFALRMGDAGSDLVAATFLVISGTVVVYGLTASQLAIRLGLSSANPQGLLIAGAAPGTRAIAKAVHAAGFPVLLVDNNRGNINTARQEGLPVFHANILSDEAMERVNLGGIGRFLALTPNDEVNSLAAMHFSELFGRGSVYQLSPQRTGKERVDTAAELLKGRLLFAPEITCDALNKRFAAGSIVKTTPLTEEFTWEDFVEYYRGEALVLFVISDEDTLTICTDRRAPAPKPGQKVIALVPPDA